MSRLSPSPLSLLFIVLMLSTTRASADDSLKDFFRDATQDLVSFRDKALSDHRAFRDSVLCELSQWISQPWKPKPMEPPVPVPHNEPPVPPIVIPRDEPAPAPENEPVRDNPVVAPSPQPAPEPPRPVLPPVPAAPTPEYFTFTSYGTIYRVDASPSIRKALPASSLSSPAKAVAESLDRIDSNELDRLVSSFIEQARTHRLSDWAYYKLTEHFVKAFVPTNANARKMLQGLLMLSAGYDVRYGEAPAMGRLYVLVGIQEHIINEIYYILDDNKRFYPFEETPDNGFRTSSDKFGETRLLTAQPSGKEIFDANAAPPHEISVCTHNPHCQGNQCSSPAVHYSLKGNLNRMKFFSECPLFLVPGNDNSQWTTYAMTRLSDEYEQQLYPSLRKILGGMSKLDAANFLMKFVETFEYKLDSEMWGVADRAFFPDETLHYPYRDCEDGAILFTRLVRDLLGLPSALVYYPGHLAAAVAFDTPVEGAYINARGRRYTICDPTYYYVDVGIQMPPDVIDASQAILIPLD